jgi:indolepyruvate decarboxylase
MPSVSEFLIERLENAGVKHIFGLPGDYILNFIHKVNESKKTKFINTTDENHAGFAADIYARVQGIGCVCTTYNVGTLKVCNAVAGAYAERSPMIVLSGSPGLKERNEDFMLHHMVKRFDNQLKMFKHITCYSVILEDATKAGLQIDEAFEALKHYKQPIYIELPRDVAEMPIKYDVYRQGTPQELRSDPENLQEALTEITTWLSEAKSPVIMAGVQLTRCGLGSQLVRFAERHQIPMVTTLLSKSTVNEHHPLFAGVYMGNQTTEERVRRLVDDSDCLLILGEMLTDMMLGFESPKFTKRQTIFCSIEGVKIRNHCYQDIQFSDFCEQLFKIHLPSEIRTPPELPVGRNAEFVPVLENKITSERFFEKINSLLNDKFAIIADIGGVLFGAAGLKVSHHRFISPAFYCSMGPAIPGALAFGLAKPDIRPLVLVGDGAFQMSSSELSTLLDHKLNPIVFVLNNRGYTTERFLLEGSFNDIRNWNYHKITELLGGGQGFYVETEGDLVVAIEQALKSKELSIINVSVEKMDITKSLRRMVDNLCKRV